MKKTPVRESVMWVLAAFCIVLGLVIAPSAGGSTMVPLIIGVAIGVMVYNLRRRRLAHH